MDWRYPVRIGRRGKYARSRQARDRGDELKWEKFSSASWTKDGSGFFYSRYDQPEERNQLRSQVYNQKLFFHKVGTPQSGDTLTYERPDQKEWLFSGDVSDDGN